MPSTGDIAWQPEAAPEGPVTILITNEDRRIRIFRAGVEIGHAPFTLVDPNRKFTLHVLTRLEPSADGSGLPGDRQTDSPLAGGVRRSRKPPSRRTSCLAVIQVAPEFLRQAETVVGPGTTMVIAQPASTTSTTTATETDFTVITGEK